VTSVRWPFFQPQNHFLTAELIAAGCVGAPLRHVPPLRLQSETTSGNGSEQGPAGRG
jgi:hypothetical protein